MEIVVIQLEHPIAGDDARNALLQLAEQLRSVFAEKLGRDFVAQLAPPVPFDHKVIQMIV